MVGEQAALEGAGAALMEIYESGTPEGKVEGFKPNVRAYRHAIQKALKGEVGLTTDQMKERFAEAAALGEEAVAFIDKRNWDAHQAAKIAAKEAYEKAFADYVAAEGFVEQI